MLYFILLLFLFSFINVRVLQLIDLNAQTSYGNDFAHRPYWLLFLNKIVPEFKFKSSWFLNGDEDPIIKEGLEVLIKSLNEEATLTGMGRIMAFSVLRDETNQLHCISNAIHELKQKKRLEASKGGDAPVIVLGLPRTGTTFLHSLLAQDVEN